MFWSILQLPSKFKIFLHFVLHIQSGLNVINPKKKSGPKLAVVIWLNENCSVLLKCPSPKERTAVDVTTLYSPSIFLSETFLELLEPYILKDMLGTLPPEVCCMLQNISPFSTCKKKTKKERNKDLDSELILLFSEDHASSSRALQPQRMVAASGAMCPSHGYFFFGLQSGDLS